MKYYQIIIIIALVFSSSLLAAECYYVSKPTSANPFPELSSQGECGELINQDIFQLKKKHFNKLYFSNNGLAVLLHGDSIFYVSKSGKIARTHFFDNGPDYFNGGLARTISKNKYGYIDEQLNIVIKPEYDFAFPFEDGTAIVCNDCLTESDGEHSIVVKGTWGVINKTGKVVVPLKYSKKELRLSKDYKRITKNKADAESRVTY